MSEEIERIRELKKYAVLWNPRVIPVLKLFKAKIDKNALIKIKLAGSGELSTRNVKLDGYRYLKGTIRKIISPYVFADRVIKGSYEKPINFEVLYDELISLSEDYEFVSNVYVDVIEWIDLDTDFIAHMDRPGDYKEVRKLTKEYEEMTGKIIPLKEANLLKPLVLRYVKDPHWRYKKEAAELFSKPKLFEEYLPNYWAVGGIIETAEIPRVAREKVKPVKILKVQWNGILLSKEVRESE